MDAYGEPQVGPLESGRAIPALLGSIARELALVSSLDLRLSRHVAWCAVRACGVRLLLPSSGRVWQRAFLGASRRDRGRGGCFWRGRHVVLVVLPREWRGSGLWRNGVRALWGSGMCVWRPGAVLSAPGAWRWSGRSDHRVRAAHGGRALARSVYDSDVP